MSASLGRSDPLMPEPLAAAADSLYLAGTVAATAEGPGNLAGTRVAGSRTADTLVAGKEVAASKEVAGGTEIARNPAEAADTHVAAVDTVEVAPAMTAASVDTVRESAAQADRSAAVVVVRCLADRS